mgnify:CR=1 FL=1|tara:strand:- start:36 stop:695 length:660 start_codon:yes stop_codon:yes gene_type:complete
MNRKILIGLVLLMGLGLGVYFFTNPKTVEQVGLDSEAPNEQAIEEINTSIIKEMALGAKTAPIKVVEYASFTCPHCRSFHEESFKKLKADYIDTNKVHFTYREIYFDRYGLWGSIIARCGGQDKFFAITDLLYTKQSEWTKGTPAEIGDNLRRIGITAGLSQDAVQACLSDSQKAQNLVAWYEKNLAADNIDSTPSFVINGIKYANMPYEEFKKILDAQ